MTELDTALRAMLRERAADIDSLPAALADLSSLDVVDSTGGHRSPRGRRTGWLAAAAVAAVLAVVATALAIRSGSGSKPVAPATHAPTPTSAVTPTPPARRADAALEWKIGIDLPKGYELMDRALGPTYQLLGLALKGDPDATCNCMAPRTTYVKVYSSGGFDPATMKMRVSTSVGGQPAYLGTLNPGTYDGTIPITHDRLPTLAWRYAANSWATVSADTPTTEKPEQLRLVATHVRIGSHTKIAVPLRLPSIPGYLHLIGATQDLHDTQFGTSITLTDGGSIADDATRTLHIQVWRDGAGPTFGNSGSPISAGGRAGSEAGTDAAFRLGTVTVEISVNGTGVSTASFNAMLQGIQWAPDAGGNEADWYAATTLFS